MAADSGPTHHDAVHAPDHAPAAPETAPPLLDPAWPFALDGAAALLQDPRLQGRGNGPVRQALAHQLQRTVGNRAVQRLMQRGAAPVPVQRAPPGPPATSATAAPAAGGPLDASMLTVTGGQPQLVGTVMVEPEGTEFARVKGPSVNMAPVDVALAPSVTLPPGEVIKVGPVQSLLGSERVGVYREDGAAATAAPVEQHFTVGQSRDGARGHYAPDEPVFERAQAPWFLPPATLSAVHTNDTLNFNEGGTANLFDQPSWLLPLITGKAKLVETRGQDSFITSIAAQRGSALVHFHPTKWSIPWAVKNIDAAHRGTGGTGTSAPSKDVPPTVDGKIAAFQPGQHWISFPTLADAQGADTSTLLMNLVAAKANDATSWTNCAEALRLRNPTFTVTFTVETTHGNIGRDHLFLTARGSKTATRKECKLNNGDSADYSFRLNDVLDPAAIEAGTQITFDILLDTVIGDNITASPGWGYPFGTLNNGFPFGDGKYRLKGSHT